MWLNLFLLLQFSVIYAILLPHTYASPVGPTGPVLEAEGWTPVRTSQVYIFQSNTNFDIYIYIYYFFIGNYFNKYLVHSYSFYLFQAVRIPQEYLNEDPNVNKLPLDRSFNEATIYNNYGKKISS